MFFTITFFNSKKGVVIVLHVNNYTTFAPIVVLHSGMNGKNKLALGTVQFCLDYGINNKTGRVNNDEITRILCEAHRSGIRFIDTAQAYGNSEQVLGECIAETTCSFDIITKISKDNTSRLTESLRESLDKLHQESVSGVLYHSFDAFKTNPRSVEELYKLKSDGIVSNIGFSLYSPFELEYIFSQDINFDFLQIPFNIFDRRFAPYLPLLKRKGVTVFCRSSFLQGLIFIKPADLHPYFSALRPKQELLHKLAEKHTISLASLCLNFCTSQEDIDYVVIGVDNYSNLEWNLRTVTERERVKAIIEELDPLLETDEQLLLPYNWKIS